MSTAHDFLIPEFKLGHRMGLALDNAGHSVQAAADYYGCSRQTISNWINNRIVPTLADLRLWAMWTGVPLQWLQTGEAPDPRGGGEIGNNNGLDTVRFSTDSAAFTHHASRFAHAA